MLKEDREYKVGKKMKIPGIDKKNKKGRVLHVRL